MSHYWVGFGLGFGVKNGLEIHAQGVLNPIFDLFLASVEMQKLIVSDEDPDDGIMSGVDGDRTVYTSALQVIDQLAMYVPAEKIIGSLANNISGLLKESVPNSQRAGLLILSVIVEGCADLIMLNYMDDLVPMVCQHLTNAEGSVRSAAYFALGQFSEHLQPDIADYFWGWEIGRLGLQVIFNPELEAAFGLFY